MKKRKFIALLLSFLVCQTCSVGVLADGPPKTSTTKSPKPPSPDKKSRRGRPVTIANVDNSKPEYKDIPFKQIGPNNERQKITIEKWKEMIEESKQKQEQKQKQIIDESKYKFTDDENFVCNICENNGKDKGFKILLNTNRKRKYIRALIFCNKCTTMIVIYTDLSGIPLKGYKSIKQRHILSYFKHILYDENTNKFLDGSKRCNSCGFCFNGDVIYCPIDTCRCTRYTNISQDNSDSETHLIDERLAGKPCPNCKNDREIWVLNPSKFYRKKYDSSKDNADIYMCLRCNTLYGNTELAKKILDYARRISNEINLLNFIKVHGENNRPLQQTETNPSHILPSLSPTDNPPPQLQSQHQVSVNNFFYNCFNSVLYPQQVPDAQYQQPPQYAPYTQQAPLNFYPTNEQNLEEVPAFIPDAQSLQYVPYTQQVPDAQYQPNQEGISSRNPAYSGLQRVIMSSVPNFENQHFPTYSLNIVSAVPMQ